VTGAVALQPPTRSRAGIDERTSADTALQFERVARQAFALGTMRAFQGLPADAVRSEEPAMSLHTQLLRGLFALPAAVLIAIAGLVAPPASAIPCDTDAAVSLPRVEVVAGDAHVVIVRKEVATR